MARDSKTTKSFTLGPNNLPIFNKPKRKPIPKPKNREAECSDKKLISQSIIL